MECSGSERRRRAAASSIECARRCGCCCGFSTNPLWQLVELQNIGRAEPRDVLRALLRHGDRQLYAAIRERRAAGAGSARNDVLSLLLEAGDEDGRPLTDEELRDELLTLVLAGHETTANSLAWTVERLLQTPVAYERLRGLARAGDRTASDAYVEATIHEGMRTRPVIPMIVRMVKRPWRFGELSCRQTRPWPSASSRFTTAPTYIPTRTNFVPSGSWTASRAPTHGSRSVEGSAAVWARHSRWPSSKSCSRRSPAGPT